MRPWVAARWVLTRCINEDSLRTAAFNNGRGQLFFNAAAFCGEGRSAELASVAAHWWGVFAHELAHNSCTLQCAPPSFAWD